jgi:hypothetical protein
VTHARSTLGRIEVVEKDVGERKEVRCEVRAGRAECVDREQGPVSDVDRHWSSWQMTRRIFSGVL